jgi:hypothetical protein
MIKAIGEHQNPKETAYHYELVEFRPNGAFMVKPAVFIKDTEMRADGDRSYEMFEDGNYKLISAAEFQSYKTMWDSLRNALGYVQVDSEGK